MKKLKTFFASLALSTAVLIPTFSQADIQAQIAQYLRPIAAQLALFEGLAENSGWFRSHDRKISALRQGQSEILHLDLDSNSRYKMMSFCDNDCSDLDLTLYDENDNQVATDISTDSFPIVNISPRWSGHFHLKVTMYNCNSDPCIYGVTTMAQ